MCKFRIQSVAPLRAKYSFEICAPLIIIKELEEQIIIGSWRKSIVGYDPFKF